MLEEGGDITVGRVGPIPCVASAATSYDCPVMLDRSFGKVWDTETPIDEVNA